MSELKPISRESIPRALAKAERYRLLNEPFEAESICRDVLGVDPDNSEALICLTLSLTDRFPGAHVKIDDARTVVSRLTSACDRQYYAGVVEERWAKALMHASYPTGLVERFIRSAMHHFENAEELAPEGNDDAVLRWNACVRLMAREDLVAEPGNAFDDAGSFDDDVPMR